MFFIVVRRLPDKKVVVALNLFGLIICPLIYIALVFSLKRVAEVTSEADSSGAE